jgi:hypothetical protein
MSFFLVVNGWGLQIEPLPWNCLSKHARDWKSLFERMAALLAAESWPELAPVAKIYLLKENGHVAATFTAPITGAQFTLNSCDR